MLSLKYMQERRRLPITAALQCFGFGFSGAKRIRQASQMMSGESQREAGQNAHDGTASSAALHLISPGSVLRWRACRVISLWNRFFFPSLSLTSPTLIVLSPPFSLLIFHFTFSQTCREVRPSTGAPLIYAGLCRANSSLTFSLTVQCTLFPKGLIKKWYSGSQEKERPASEWIS